MSGAKDYLIAFAERNNLDPADPATWEAAQEEGNDMTKFTENEAIALRRSTNHMPYGGMVHVPRTFDGPADVVTYLDALAAVLRDVAARNDALQRECGDLKIQRTAMRAFLGTA